MPALGASPPPPPPQSEGDFGRMNQREARIIFQHVQRDEEREAPPPRVAAPYRIKVPSTPPKKYVNGRKQNKNRMECVRGERVHPEYAFWNNFVIHLKKTFATEEEIREEKQLMRELKYTNIAKYLRECQSLNLTIGRSGEDWREEVELLLPRKINSLVGRSGKFATDEEWVEEVLRVCLLEQTMDRQDKLCNTGFAATNATAKQYEKGSAPSRRKAVTNR
ncbi:hypothetical protein Q9L58_010640 [Maublancomyces gigas]|uniref:Retrotransposon gag domain-containing protein n=1 Tax=Discina gigas TaxID=1032678 RepID=A0ABR3G3I0_9PEZI